eukprot:scaffold4967_cov175-Prasinococcus_capsulatus_cf.AAC.1
MRSRRRSVTSCFRRAGDLATQRHANARAPGAATPYRYCTTAAVARVAYSRRTLLTTARAQLDDPCSRNSHGTQQPGRHAAPRLSKEGAAGRVGQRLAAPAEPAGGLGSQPGGLLCSSPSDRAGPSPAGRAGRSQARPVEPPRPPGGWRGGR